MKFFVTGVAGQLGHDVMNELHKRGFEALGLILHRSTAVYRIIPRLLKCLMFPWTLQMPGP